MGKGDPVNRFEDRLQEAYDAVEAPTKLVGRSIPSLARAWAEEHGLEVQATSFAPDHRLYIIGAFPVPDAIDTRREP
jgi:hypothetical protein